MKIVTTDLDIHVYGRDKILEGLECIFGRIDPENNKVEKHPTGVYFQNVPRDPTTNMSTLDHRIANDYGYFKIDFLNVNMYAGIRDEAHLLELLHKEPPWDFFEYEEITDQLFHLNGRSKLLQRLKPTSVEELAMILAIIRPPKAYLQSADWDTIREEVWIKTAMPGQFKKSHAIAYSHVVIVNLNLLIEKLSKD